MINRFNRKGKIIRDVVHGDIFIPNEFLEVIDTLEFQRLRRIKQLSIANMVFPSADHTRFSHSIGTFYIMTQMIIHFRENFETLHINITKNEENIILLAALLHDLGHGPFSHAFEGILPQIHDNIKHEEWTKRIIESKDSNVNKAIVKNFGEDIPEKVIELISNQKKIKKEEDVYILEKVDMFNVLSSLISSQLDADRMDYLLRDSMQCGVTFGNIDIQRIITSLEITVQDDKYYVCVPEKYVQDIETYILARYQMQKVVYYHDFKIQMEQLIKKILSRAYELFGQKKLNYCPELIRKLFKCEITVKDYVEMDDSLFQYAFSVWRNEDDVILKQLCNSLMTRSKAKKVDALDNSDKYLQMLKTDIMKLFKQYGYNIIDLREEYFWIENKPGFSAYKKNKENIWIRQSNGIISDLSQVSIIFNKLEGDSIIWKDDKNIIFINYNILRKMPIENMCELIEDLKMILNNYDLRNTIEIEKKYILNSKSVFKEVDKFINNQEFYVVKKLDEKNQIDYYYDTEDLQLKRNDYTLRIREKNEKYELTIKIPVPMNSDTDSSQSERFEFKKIVKGKDDLDVDFIKEHIIELSSISDLKPSIIIKNFRVPIIMEHDDIKFEMVYDNVRYCENMNDEGVEDFQIEIELKSEYQHRVNLKILTDEMEREIKELKISDISKYKRGMSLLESI
ncbi:MULTISPECIES: CYTH domain-containing protein [unclassified Sedimentibacter]|uniref:CYTH domain-containing protein n=1 Tax=unclassified Sedimentibacter TaxID=2649220 RepID=UPI0027E0F9DF|nr:CYTH domain-containing protein [Sedimentibacter sp. MB35-C1]WMJ77790.1 CYTH domain-containing protein [Sedimentibacter sp. MB35-C1]